MTNCISSTRGSLHHLKLILTTHCLKLLFVSDVTKCLWLLCLLWQEIFCGQEDACVILRCSRWLTCARQHPCWSLAFRLFSNCLETIPNSQRWEANLKQKCVFALSPLTPTSYFPGKMLKGLSKVRQWYALCISKFSRLMNSATCSHVHKRSTVRNQTTSSFVCDSHIPNTPSSTPESRATQFWEVNLNKHFI